MIEYVLSTHVRFMQLNPARGRKLEHIARLGNKNDAGLCSSTPRGDGNMARMEERSGGALLRFMQLNPARGRKQGREPAGAGMRAPVVYAAQPREGTETP